MPDISSGFKPGDDEIFRRIFKQWDGGSWADETFAEVFALATTQTVVEVVIPRRRGSVIETLTRPRPDNDPVLKWRRKYHTLGSALRAADAKKPVGEQYNAALERIVKQELNGVPFLYPPQYVRIEPPMLRDTLYRGTETVIAFFAEVADDAVLPDDVRWLDIMTLEGDESFLQHQVEHVLLATATWQKYKMGSAML